MLLLRQELASGLDDPSRLLGAVQTAVMLEHSTIPPYLYALYSLLPGTNDEIATLIRSVVVEEMTHMGLVCNLLNALGGQPGIDRPEFIPRYPGPLPGSVESGLTVPLAPFSKRLVEKVFMVIEEPEEPHKYRSLTDAAAPHITIGMFYAAIRKQMAGATFVPDLRKQVTHPLLPELVAITDADSACTAIDVIVEQGEGTKTSPLDAEGDELAHFYRFEEITKGRYLVADPSDPQGWSYTGDPIPFAQSGVRPVVESPKSSGYPAGSYARQMSDTFNYEYTGMLKSLHATFNGHPDRLDAAIGMMESLKQQAIALMEIEVGGGKCAGPTFEYQPVSV